MKPLPTQPIVIPGMQDWLRCSACGDALGVYEPLVAISRGSGRITSLAREPNVQSGTDALVHRNCALEGRATQAGLSAAAAADLPR
jgi:hypothetical protein